MGNTAMQCHILCGWILVLVIFYTVQTCSGDTDSANHWYLRVSNKKLVFDDGTPFVPVGLSIKGMGGLLDGSTQFEALWGMTPTQWFDKLQAAGVNFLRI